MLQSEKWKIFKYSEQRPYKPSLKSLINTIIRNVHFVITISSEKFTICYLTFSFLYI